MTNIGKPNPDPDGDLVEGRFTRYESAEDFITSLERYVEDFDDLDIALQRLRDPSDPVLDWGQVKCALLDSD